MDKVLPEVLLLQEADLVAYVRIRGTDELPIVSYGVEVVSNGKTVQDLLIEEDGDGLLASDRAQERRSNPARYAIQTVEYLASVLKINGGNPVKKASFAIRDLDRLIPTDFVKV